ncbi:hypothetical protein G3N58_17770 [Paraburkholderia sp. Ac-20342]|nr:hypothetical protein [Paraburkholderia sp. Ac-20342]MBN3848657.1 hypothetical protein [Paraburkholderia sp. Ac-20342]
MDDFGNLYGVDEMCLSFESWTQRLFFLEPEMLFYVYERDMRWGARYGK